VDGAVAGTWKYDDGTVKLEPFEPLSRAVRRQLEEEADRLADFHDATQAGAADARVAQSGR
jgi:hypothetical protein